jgi:hypothetical protein
MSGQIAHGQSSASEIAQGPVERLTEWLELSLGIELTAFAVGVSPSEIARFAHGERPDSEAERRLRNLYAVASLLTAKDGPGSARDWLVASNPELEDRAPCELLRAGDPAEAVWFAAAPAF